MNTATHTVRITASDENGVENPSEFVSLATGRKVTARDGDLPRNLAKRLADALSAAAWDEFADVGGPDEPVFVSRSATIELMLTADEMRSVLAASTKVSESKTAPAVNSKCRGEMICREFSSGDGDCLCGMRFPGEC